MPNSKNVTENTIEVVPENRFSPPLEEPIKDNLTLEQRKRDEHTTTLYKQFVEAHNEKKSFAKGSKTAIRACCIVWVSVLVFSCIVLSAFILVGTNRSLTDIVALISAIIPLIVAIIGTLNIVTQYVFPEGEDRNITEIVKQIHENDLKNKQVNMSNKENE